jgi:hypothetical protein
LSVKYRLVTTRFVSSISNLLAKFQLRFERLQGLCVHNMKIGLSTRIVQALGGWEQITMVERYSKSLTFDDALGVYQRVNGG